MSEEESRGEQQRNLEDQEFREDGPKHQKRVAARAQSRHAERAQ
jgi:hypothetical protein